MLLHLKQRLVPDWIREVPIFLQNQLSAYTRRAYQTDLKQFFAFLENYHISPSEIEKLTSRHIIGYRKQLEDAGLQKSTINRKLATVKSFFQWLRLNNIVFENPASLVKGFPQNQESPLKGLSDDEAKRILMAPKLKSRAGALHSAVLHVLLYMGLRKGELMDLRIGDISEERGVPVLKVRGKGHRIRILPITEKVLQAIDHYFDVCKRDRNHTDLPLFTPTKNPRRNTYHEKLTPHSITYIVSRYAKLAGITKRISPHSCRATCISNALDRKATHRSVQHLAGWSTPLMIQRYDKRREDLRNSAAYLIDFG
jgi:site-specific recombinase XerD